MPHGSFKYSQADGGPCQGDSGGPGLVSIGGIEYVAGVTSFGDGACAAYGISSATQDYSVWIGEHAPEVFGLYAEKCDNSFDDDGDGYADCADPDCASDPACAPVPDFKEDCTNSFDDDGDGYADCADPDCASDPACKRPPVTENCTNGLDDDGDGYADCADPDCASDSSCERPPVTENCTNGRDDDGDGYADCADPDCAQEHVCIVLPQAEICNNGVDDDRDKLTDCRDPDCADATVCNVVRVYADSCSASPCRPLKTPIFYIAVLFCTGLIALRRRMINVK